MVEYSKELVESLLDKKNTYVYSKNRRKERRSNDIITFDIEVTTLWNFGKNKWDVYDFNKEEDFYKNRETIAIPYIWQASINGTCFFSRFFDEAKEFFTTLHDTGIKYIIYVHNLSYEFQFILNLSSVETVFARKPHQIYKCVYSEFTNLEFRCSWFLTRLKLEDWAKEIGGIEKKVGDLDYNTFRTPLTPMTTKELGYCEYDVLIMYKGLLRYREKYGKVHSIPLTQTGEVRLEVKKESKQCGFDKRSVKMQPINYVEYSRLLCATRGGDSHGNCLFVDKLIKDVDAYDYVSSYPFRMVTEKYPMSKFVPLGYDESKRKHFAYLLEVEFINIESKGALHYIAQANCLEKKGVVNDNGRVIKAKYLKMVITDIDYDIINECYKYDEKKILDSYGSIKGYLPPELCRLIMKRFNEKTSFKKVKGMEAIYLASKQFINSIFGMALTKIIHDDVTFNLDDGWNVVERDLLEVDKLLVKNSKYPSKNPLPYQFGLWVVTYGRQGLWELLLALGENTVIYWDTDSVYVPRSKKPFVMKIINKTNRINAEKLEMARIRIGLTKDDMYPKAPNGEVQYLGKLVLDGEYSEFKTLGSKKYVVRKKKDNSIAITVAGLRKECARYISDLNEFKNGISFTREQTRKNQAVYNDNQPTIILKDGFKSTYKYGISMRPVSHTISMASDFVSLLEII